MPPRTKSQRAADILKGLTSIAVLVAIIGGIPMALLRFGSQWLPKTMPTLDQAKDALGRQAGDGAILTGLTLTVWVLWVLFTAAVAVEVLSWARHAASPSTRHRAAAPAAPSRFRIPGLQNAAAGLVMSALLVLPTAGAASASSSPPVSPPPAALVVPGQVTLPPTSPGPAPNAAAPSAGQQERVTVKRGDSPWRIAQRHLGAGERWRELRYADGHALGSEMIHPGQILLVPSTPEPSAPTQAASASVPAADTAAPKTVVVRPGDSLSEIADRELGDSEQSLGIWTANRGHVMSDGRRFTDPDLIRPGWALAMPGRAAATPAAPAAATAATPPPAPPPAPAPAEAPDAPDEKPDQAATATTTPPPPAPAETTQATVDPAPAPTPAPAEAPDPPDELPAPTTPVTTIWPPSPTGQTEPAAGPAGNAAAPTATASKGGRKTAVPAPVGVGAAGLAGAAVLALVARRRKAQLGRRRPGRRPPLPTGEDARVEAAMREGADPEGSVLLADALAAVALTVDVDGDGLPEILGAHLTGNRIELLLTSAAPTVPESFTASEDGLRWSATSSGVIELADRPSNPAPAMVTLGATDVGTLLINLETIGLLVLQGDQERAAGVLCRMAFELGAPFLAGILHLVVVGLPEVTGLEAHVESAASLGDALDRAAWLVGGREEQLATFGAGTADAARAAGLNGDTWAPVVVLAAGPVTEEELQRAGAVTVDPTRSGIAVVVAAERTTARWALDLDDDQVDVGPLGLSVDPRAACPTRVVGYERKDAEAVSAVLETSLRLGDVAAGEPPYDTIDDEWGWPTPAADETHDAEDVPAGEEEESETPAGGHLHVVAVHDPEPVFDIVIRVLGPIEIDGSGIFSRGKGKELVVALALQHRGLTTAQLDELLWPGGQAVGSTRNSTVSSARAGLRRTDKEDLVPYRAVDGGPPLYRLDPCVGTDWDRFRWLARTAAGAGEADGLTEALTLVRGEPLGAPSSGWAWAVPHITEMVCAIGDVAHRLAQLRLEALDLPRATAAARAGLRGAPWDQRLYGDLMEAADAAGNPAGATAIYNELVRLLEDLDNDHPHSDIEAIYRRCRNRKHQAT